MTGHGNSRIVAFYDVIAGSYDEQMAALPGDRWVRTAFREFVSRTVPAPSRILDFGCGPGSDAAWYCEQGHQVIAYDRSAAMVEQLQLRHNALVSTGAITPLHGPFTALLDDLATLPPLDAAVSNFAVLNLIEDPSEVFRGLAEHITLGGHVIVSVLNPLFWKEYRERSFWSSLFRSIGRPAIVIKGEHTNLYRHWAGALERAAQPHFRLARRASVGALIRRWHGQHDWHRPATLAERIECSTWHRFPMTRLGQFHFLSFQRKR